jgi:hypothetical protein
VGVCQVLLDRFEAMADPETSNLKLSSHDNTPFEIYALESIFVSVFTELNRTVAALRKRLPTILEKVGRRRYS